MTRRLAVLAALVVALPLAAQDLRLDYERQSLVATYRHYTQYVDDLPVVGGEVIERVEPDGTTRVLHRSIAAAAPKRPVIAMSTAAARVAPRSVADEQLVALNVDGVARPAWRLVVEDAPRRPYAHYIDAATGDELRVEPLFAQATAKARVFDPNPVAKLNDPSLRDRNDAASAVPESAYTLVDLLDLPPSGMLVGPNVQIVDTDLPNTTHADASQPLLFDRSQPQFEEVNAYFHLDRGQRYLQTLGYTGARRLVDYAIPVDPHAVGGSDNSLYATTLTPGRGRLFFGDGGVDDAEDSDILLHEYCHAIQDWIAPGVFLAGSFGTQARALGEGWGDYWAYSSGYEAGRASARDPYCIADWDPRCAGDDGSQNCGYKDGADCLRRVDSTKTMADYITSDAAGTEHRNGEIWSSALREIFDELVRRNGADAGRRAADTLVLESMFGAPSSPTFALIAGHMLDADRALNGGANVPAICSAFLARGILSAADCERAPRGEITFVQSPDHGVAIPDDPARAITANVDVTDARSIDRLAVAVNISHPSRGDLQISLTAPDGTTVILQNASSDRAAASQVTYGIDAATVDRLDVFHGRPANGRWTLTVRDLQPQNAGTLLSWSLGITFLGDAPATIRPSSLAPRRHIAAVAHTAGALGTSWRTDLRIYNGAATAANVTVVFTPAGEDGWTHFSAVKLSIAPRQVVSLDDVVGATMQSTGIGQLELLGDTDALVVSSRTYNLRAAGGTFGQFIPAASTDEASWTAYVPHIEASGDFRTNIGFAEVGGSAATVRVTLYDAGSGAVISQRDVDVPPFGQVQFPAEGAALMTAEFQVLSGDARPSDALILAYGSVVDNRTGDPIYVPSSLPSGGSFIAAVIRQPGSLGTFWRSDIVITAPASTGGGYTLTYVDAATGERLTKSGSVAAHQAVRLDDVVGSLFGRTSGFGAIRADLAQTLVATSRTFTTSTEGTYGQFIPLLHGEEGLAPLTPGGPARELLHVEQSAAFRTNLGAINSGGSDARIRFTAFDAAGNERGSTERTVGPLQVVQFGLDALTSSPLAGGRVEVQMLSGSRGAIAWASVVDNVSGDPIFVPAR